MHVLVSCLGESFQTCIYLAEQLAAVPELANLGALFKSSQPVEITESETEYYVQCIKHTFSNYMVFQVSATLGERMQGRAGV